jgi:hypothetical protein
MPTAEVFCRAASICNVLAAVTAERCWGDVARSRRHAPSPLVYLSRLAAIAASPFTTTCSPRFHKPRLRRSTRLVPASQQCCWAAKTAA